MQPRDEHEAEEQLFVNACAERERDGPQQRTRAFAIEAELVEDGQHDGGA